MTSIEMYKNTKSIANKNKYICDTQKNKTQKNKSIKQFSKTDQVQNSLSFSLLK